MRASFAERFEPVPGEASSGFGETFFGFVCFIWCVSASAVFCFLPAFFSRDGGEGSPSESLAKCFGSSSPKSPSWSSKSARSTVSKPPIDFAPSLPPLDAPFPFDGAGTSFERSRAFMSISSSSTKPSSCAPKMRRFGSYFTLLHPPTLSQSTVSRSTPSAPTLPPPGTSISASRGPCSAAFLFARRTLLPTLDGFALRPPPPLPPTKPMATEGVELASGRSSRPARGSTSQESTCVSFAARRPRRTA
mmetsp:Transcript_11789/g.50524  ORF Transcript_11789/g.50524 Transcript_11789/m.50524 type:complete len:248 (-) Transcript_11789:40-783(-)